MVNMESYNVSLLVMELKDNADAAAISKRNDNNDPFSSQDCTTTHESKLSASSITTGKLSQQVFVPLQSGKPIMAGEKCSLDQNQFNQAVVEFIVTDELPFAFAEGNGFRIFCSKVAPGYKLPTRKIVARDIEEHLFPELDETIKKVLRKLVQEGIRFSATTDIWTCSNQTLAYMAVTIHWIDYSWEMNSLLIGFELITGVHNGENIANVFVKVLREYGLQNSLLSVTLDNAGNNATFIAFLRILLGANLACGGELLQCRCAAHIINLIVKDGVACISKDIHTLRVLVKSLRSPQKLEQFEERVTSLLVNTNADYITKARPHLDVPTRWNSTLDMISSCIPFADIFNIIGKEIFEVVDEPQRHASDRNDRFHSKTAIDANARPCKITSTGWLKLQLLENFLVPLKDATIW